MKPKVLGHYKGFEVREDETGERRRLTVCYPGCVQFYVDCKIKPWMIKRDIFNDPTIRIALDQRIEEIKIIPGEIL